MSNELYHHGILGQKWGVRRYQNPDGSLTPAGRAKLGYSPEPRKKGLFSRKKKPKAKKETAQPKPQKSINEMTLNELMDKKARLSLERDVLDLQTQIRSKNAQLNPTKKNAVKELAKEFATDTLKPAAKEASKKLLSKTIDDLLGTGDSQSLKAMEREILELQKKKTLRDLKNDMNEESSANKLLEMEREISRLQKEKSLRDLKNDMNEESSANKLLEMEREISRLQKEKSLRDLRKDLNKTDEERAYEDLKRAAEKLKIESEMEKYRNIIRNGGALNTKERWPLDNMTDEEKAMLAAILNAEGTLWQSDYGNSDELYHHGILGQKWGVRRFQNEDGSLTEAGRKRYLNSDGTVNDKRISRQERSAARLQKKIDRVVKKADKAELKRGKYAKRFFRTDASDEKFDKWSRKYAKLDAKELKLQKKFDKKYDGVDKLREAAKSELERLAKYESELSDIRKEYDSVSTEAKKLISDYHKNSEKWQCVAGAVATLWNDPDSSMEELARNMWFYAWEDGDQGPGNSSQLYFDETGKTKEATKYSNKLAEIYSRYTESRRAAKANGVEAPDLDWDAEYVLNSAIDVRPDGHGTKEFKRTVENAKRIVAKINFGKVGTWQIMQAMENAGLNDVKWSSMTDSQWARLNAELAKLGSLKHTL